MKNSSKIISLFLSLVMILSMFSVVPFNATAAEVHPEIKVGDTATVNIKNEGDVVYLKFVPDRDMRISFYSTSDIDTYVTLYDENLDECAYNDDGGEDYNFKLTYDVTADTVYYFGVECYGDGTGSFSVTLSEIFITEIQLGETATVNIDNAGDTVHLKFVPDRDMRILFYSTSDMDTYVTLYDEDFDECARNDDDGEGNNFKLIYTVEADTVYYFGVECYGDDTGSFSVTLVEHTSDWEYERDYDYDGVRITGYYGSDAEIEIPSTLDDYPVVVIDEYVFSGSENLRSITIPASVTYIGSYAFYDCESLTNITIPDSVTYIGEYAFNNTAWYNNQPNGLVYAGKVAYQYKGECPATITIKNGTKSIAARAFYDCTNLTSVTIPDSVTSIGYEAFYECPNLKSVTIPASVTSIDSEAFGYVYSRGGYYAPVEGFTIYGDIFSEAHYYARGNGFHFVALNDDSLQEIQLGKTVTINIKGEDNFTYLKFVPNRDMRILFYSTSNLDTHVEMYDKDFNFCASDDDSGTGMDFRLIYTVEAGNVYYFRVSSYEATGSFSVTLTEHTSVWEYMHNFYDDSISITSYYGDDTELTIPSSLDGYPVTSINYGVFSGNTKLKTVTIPNTITGIGNEAFAGCTGLTRVTLPNSLTYIDGYAFAGCTNLTSITIPDSVTYISYGAFYDCTKLQSITIPDSVIHVGEDAFENTAWYNHQPNGLVYAGKVAYRYKGVCPATVTIKSGTKSISTGAFSDCTNLTGVTIPDSVTAIDYRAFIGCTNLRSVTIPASVTSIEGYAFGYFYDEDYDDYVPVDGFTIYGDRFSAAHYYANYNDFIFIPLNGAAVIGDADGDGEVTIQDVTEIQHCLSYMNANVTDLTLMNADVDGNGEIEITDITLIQRYLAGMEIPYPIG